MEASRIVIAVAEAATREWLIEMTLHLKTDAEIKAFDDIEETISYCRTFQVDLLVAACLSTGIFAIQLIREFRKLPDYDETPVVVWLGSDNPEFKSLARILKVVDFCYLPWGGNEFRTVARHLLSIVRSKRV